MRSGLFAFGGWCDGEADNGVGLAPLPQPAGEQFRAFDDEAAGLMNSLHLDAEDEPRRAMGAASRANSVRFDETANQNHFSHSSRSSVDMLSRAATPGGSHVNEGTSSHKSDRRASSAHSIRSAASGRANSLNLDGGDHIGDAHRSPLDAPALAPGLLLLGSVPAIIRCWMTTTFTHDALLYAAVCTGSYTSFLDVRLLRKLGLLSLVETDTHGRRTVELPVYFPEAVPHPASSRSSSPAPTLPTLTVDFTVVEHETPPSTSPTSPPPNADDGNDKAVQIFLGSDVLRAHSADVLFSSNSMTLLDDDRTKLSVPLVRPECEAAFKHLYVASAAASQPPGSPLPCKSRSRPHLNGLARGNSVASSSANSPTTSAAAAAAASSRAVHAAAGETERPRAASIRAGVVAGAVASEPDRPSSQASHSSRPPLPSLHTTHTEPVPSAPAADHVSSTSASTTIPQNSRAAAWGSWRRDSQAAGPAHPGAATAGSAGIPPPPSPSVAPQRKETGIKVLKPRVSGRPGPPSSPHPQPVAQPSLPSPVTAATPTSASASAPASKTSAANPNPVGGASAFSWLNAGPGGK